MSSPMVVWVPWLLCTLAFPLSWWLTARVRTFAIARDLLDRPNDRSSHSRPTPRGGGLAFVVVVLGTLVLSLGLGLISLRLAMVLLVGGGTIAAVGWLDDRHSLAASWRLLVHLIVAAAAVGALGGVAPLALGPLQLGAGPLVQGVAVWCLAWMINLFNFMDGIDAIAAVEAISVACLGALLVGLTGAVAELPAWLPLLLAAAVAGFLVWNWPPARIFMGDVGSGFLGFAVGVFTLQASWISSDQFWSWVILSGVFLVDASVTLLRRTLRGERWTQAHRSHAFQRVAARLGRHLPVTLGVLALTLLWLAPWALLLSLGRVSALLALAAALLPLVVLAVLVGAGVNPGDRSERPR